MEALYHAALETHGEEREALLSRADPELRHKVEALLANAGIAEDKLDRPAWEWEQPEPVQTEMQPGERIGPYRIEAKVGAGSMGTVYRATDMRLQRTVALKICQAEFTHRFEREARAIAALNQPNICQIYDVGPSYIVMEWVDGAPLLSSGRMTLGDALRNATEIASAMAAAHAKGIIHRDLKPANILLTRDGTVKLVDFGIARQVQHNGGTGLATMTVGRVLIGTPAYMSPEQAECNSVDERSDIFSFGAVFYEMLSGRRAFPGNSTASILGAILHLDPDPLDAPPSLSAIVSRCLAKAPTERYQSAQELLQALQHADTTVVRARKGRTIQAAIAFGLVLLVAVAAGLWLRAHSSHDSNSIAVLPFDIQSKDTDAAYISDGIAESVNNGLSRLSVLRVIPFSITSNYKGRQADFQQIGRTLDVATVLSGRVSQRGDDLLINIELDDVRTGKQVWGQQYTRKVTELLQVQNEISREVSQKLRAQLSEADRRKMTIGSTTNPEAYRLYLKGSYYTNKFSKDGFDKGIDFLNQAIALDPEYAQAYSELADNYINQDDWYIDPKIAGPRAREAAEKALSLDGTDVRAHVALAIEEQWYEWDYTAAERNFKRAIELDPEDGEARGYYSWFLPPMLRDEEALEQAHLQLKTYPLSTGANGNLGSVMVFAHHWDEAIEQLEYAIHLDPNYWFDYCFLGRALEQQHRYSEAIDIFQRGLKMDDNAELWSGLGHAYAVSGKRAEAEKVLEHLQKLSTERYIGPYNSAIIYASLGEKDKAFELLNGAYDARSYLLVEYLNTDQRLDSLKDDPRFSTLRTRVGLPTPPTHKSR
jgi:eukaryotic-like serine/threonine-protein kinase